MSKRIKSKDYLLLRSGLIAALILTVLFFFATTYIKKINSTLVLEAQTYLQEVAIQGATNAQTKIEDTIKTLFSIASLLEQTTPNDPAAMVEHIKPLVSKNDLKRMGIINKNGLCFTTDEQTMDFSDRAYFQQSLHSGETVITPPLKDKFGGQDINVYSIPILYNNQPEAVLFATTATLELSNTLLKPSFNGDGYSLLCDKNGNLIVPPQHAAFDQTLTNISSWQFEDDFQFSNMQPGAKGTVFFKDTQGLDGLAAFTPLGINDWFVVSVIPRSSTTNPIRFLVETAIWGWLAISAAFLLIIFYITREKIKNQKELEYLAYTDTLTGYYNFNCFRLSADEQLKQMARADKPEQYLKSLVIFDIAKFKLFNDVYGYSMGDAIIQAVLSTCITFIKKGELCARISADNFILLLNDHTEEQVRARLYTLSAQIKGGEIPLKNGFNLNLCFGVSIFSPQESAFNKYYDQALFAKKEIKSGNGKEICFYSHAIRAELIREQEIEDKMEVALRNEEFLPYYQPKIDLKTGSIIGAEALVRWLEPGKGLIPPNDFIPLFEKNFFIEKLDLYVFKRVCQTLRAWLNQGLLPIKISVNISKSYIFKEGFPAKIRQIAQTYQVSPQYIEIEITESIVIDRTDQLLVVLNELRAYGFSIAMDDFGSGYSSLNMLKDIPMDVIKLDQVFFTDTKNPQRSLSIIKGIITIAKDLEAQVVAEGIEYLEQLKFLREVGCDFGQGYYFAKPLPLAELENLMRNDVKLK